MQTWITLAEAKKFLRLSHDEEDDLVKALVEVAAEVIATDIRQELASFEADGGAIPTTLRYAGLNLIGHLFENRQAVVTGTIATELPEGFDALLQRYRTKTIPYC